MSLVLLGFMTAQGRRLRPHADRAQPVPHPLSSFLHFFFLSLTGMVGYWATLSLNIPDFTRYAKSQDSQIVGQAFGLPRRDDAVHLHRDRLHFGLHCRLRPPIWNPITLLGLFHQPLVAFLALISILIATLNVNIGANVVSPSNDFSHLAPQAHQFPHRRPDHRLHWPCHDALEADGEPHRLHSVAGQLLGAAGAGGRNHDRRLLLSSATRGWIRSPSTGARGRMSIARESIRAR